MAILVDRSGAGRRHRLRPATAGDANRLAALASELGYPSSAAEVERRLGQIEGDEDHFVCVAELDGDHPIGGPAPVVGPGISPEIQPVIGPAIAPVGPMGWIHAFVVRLIESGPRVEIGGLVVDEKQRGAGVGKALIEQAEAWARSKGIGEVVVRSNVIRKDAHRFYQRLGYNLVKTQFTFSKKLRGAKRRLPVKRSAYSRRSCRIGIVH